MVTVTVAVASNLQLLIESATMAGVIPVNNETHSVMSRVTKDGRKLTYDIRVLQQPQRARACGSGAKCTLSLPPRLLFLSPSVVGKLGVTDADCLTASADRRPVDPPPVVELKILEGDAKTDVTFSHNANFFLFTTLESARPIAQARGTTLPAQCPVLTGAPVAGMAYLDRPSPAGYFIFPDLSVRHEGKYRLSFNLFEELKEEKDADAEPALGHPDHPNDKLMTVSPMTPQSHVHFRLEVKSEPFIVFSAKKFPGLAESTQLSRVVAEQGCRVRIRRDVRMRRRDAKSTKEYEYDEDEGAAYVRPDRYQTPDVYAQQPAPDRARSISNASVEPHTPYANIERRPSTQDLYYGQQTYQPQQQSGLGPGPQAVINNYGSHLAFGGSSTPHYQTPALQPSNAPIAPPSSAYVLGSPSYPPHPSGPHVRQSSNPTGYLYLTGQAYQQPQQYSQQPAYPEGADYKSSVGYRHASQPVDTTAYPANAMIFAAAEPRTANQIPQNYYPPSAPNPVPRSATPGGAQQLPPLKVLQPTTERDYEASERKLENAPSQSSAMPGPTLASSSHLSHDSASQSYLYAVPASLSAESTTRPAKRSYSKVFNTAHLNQPMQSGMRPDLLNHGQDVGHIQLDDGTVEDVSEVPNFNLLSYRRADGSRQHKKCPSPIAG